MQVGTSTKISNCLYKYIIYHIYFFHKNIYFPASVSCTQSSDLHLQTAFALSTLVQNCIPLYKKWTFKPLRRLNVLLESEHICFEIHMATRPSVTTEHFGTLTHTHTRTGTHAHTYTFTGACMKTSHVDP